MDHQVKMSVLVIFLMGFFQSQLECTVKQLHTSLSLRYIYHGNYFTINKLASITGRCVPSRSGPFPPYLGLKAFSVHLARKTTLMLVEVAHVHSIDLVEAHSCVCRFRKRDEQYCSFKKGVRGAVL